MKNDNIVEIQEPSLFTVNNEEIKKVVQEYSNAGATHLNNAYGPSIDKFLETTCAPFYYHMKTAGELIEYALFYCFKAALYAKSYKHEHPTKLLPFQINELVYNDIFKEIKIDSINFTLNQNIVK